MFIHLTSEITLIVTLNTVSLDYSFDPASINIECLETLGETLGSDTVPTQEPSTADSTVPNSAQKPNVDQCSDTLKNHSYMYRIGAVAGILLTVGVVVGVWYFSGGHFPPTDFGSGSQIPLIIKSVEIHTPLPEVKANLSNNGALAKDRLFDRLAKVETQTSFLPEDTLNMHMKILLDTKNLSKQMPLRLILNDYYSKKK